MQIPLEIIYRDVPRTEQLDALIRRKSERLEKRYPSIMSCQVAVEKPHMHQRGGRPFRIRIFITMPPGHRIAAEQAAGNGDKFVDIEHEIRHAFREVEKQIQKLKEKQHREGKVHPFQSVQAVVGELNRDEGYGYLRTVEDGRLIFFHRNSVLHNGFDALKPGIGVRFTEEMGEKGPQASSVQVVEVPESL